jgi:hypothetical protein
MNDWDRNNLNFLLSLKTEEEWQDWADQQESDDLEYALTLIRVAINEDTIKLLEIEEAFQEETGLDCTEALSFINRVKKESL